ncbi:MAG: ATP-binding cassette domain-containing protein, partial [Lachnospiraceae bacterium]|nr:ATP-binding cassette domain-containing protein [Lachnospiraceae bacterium]
QVTFLGRTGSGKSTIFKLILGLYAPQSGEVYICGRKAQNIPDTEKRKMFGYVQQTFHMVPGTVKDQITLFDSAISMDQVRTAAKMAGIDDTIMDFEQGYETHCTEEMFSQGQLQLLAIARAVVAEPRLLLLDEITANLDAQTEECLMKALKRVSADRTVLSISHRIHAETGRVVRIGQG